MKPPRKKYFSSRTNTGVPRLDGRTKKAKTPPSYPRLSIVYLKEYARRWVEGVSGTPEERNRPWLVVQSNTINPIGEFRELMIVPMTAQWVDGKDRGTTIFVGMPAMSGLKAQSSAICDKIVAIRRKHISHTGGSLSRTEPSVARIDRALKIALGLE